MDIGNTRRQPSWIFPGKARTRAAPEQAASFLALLSSGDRDLFVLSHGLGLDLGTAAYAMRLDPSIVSWRLRRALMASEIAAEPGELERGVAALLAEDTTGTWNLSARLEAMPASVRERLEARQTRQGAGATEDEARSGLGIGAVVLVLLAMIGFIAYGVIRDEDPMWRGKARVRQGQYASARNAFRELGNLPEARAWTAITWLAEGNYGKANEVLQEQGAMQYLASFRPLDTDLETLDVETGSSALLPRGLITRDRPEFVFAGASAGVLTVEQTAQDDAPAEASRRTLHVSEPPAGEPIVRLDFPANWKPLAAGSYVWTAPGGAPNGASFTVMSHEQRNQIQRHSWQRLSHDIPVNARTFLRGHYFLRSELYMQAGNQFRDLAQAFPDEPYPRQVLERIGTALGVDPTAFLR